MILLHGKQLPFARSSNDDHHLGYQGSLYDTDVPIRYDSSITEGTEGLNPILNA
jgi:hypothetical protein